MPKYLYSCANCKAMISMYHAMSESREDCIECDTPGSLTKKPSTFNTEPAADSAKAAGELVKQSIEEFKEDLANQKDELKVDFVDE